MATAVVPKVKVIGGSFLIQEHDLEDVFTVEDLSEEHRQIAQTAHEFAQKEIIPNLERIEHKEFAVTRELLRKAAEIGIGNLDIPEEYGGAAMDKISTAVVVEHLSSSPSFNVSFGAHTGIGTLPILYFGTKEQKARYLPKLARAEWIAAFALSESTSGSDSLNARTKAVLSPDGKEWILNGEKMWISNGGFADIFIVFAKVDGEKFSAFIVEKTFPGFQAGAEEKKLGIRGSSTTPIIMNDCRVPRENLLGEIGKGHIVAFNTLNVGRFKLGAGAVGNGKRALQNSVNYAKQRKAWGKVIADFGLIKEKLATMAAGIYTLESMSYRAVGLIAAALAEVDKDAPDGYIQTAKACEEYAVECSILKVWGSEMLGYVTDETVQIFGGYGFVEEYPAERAYRDARILRIFEGTNEINRMLITQMLIRRASAGRLALTSAVKKLMDEITSGPGDSEAQEGTLAAERALIVNAKKAALMLAGAALEKFGADLTNQQEVISAISDVVIEVYAMDSVLLRTQKLIDRDGETKAKLAVTMTQVSLASSFDKIEAAAKKALAAVAEGDARRSQLSVLRRLLKHELYNTIALNHQIADRMIEAGKYVIR